MHETPEKVDQAQPEHLYVSALAIAIPVPSPLVLRDIGAEVVRILKEQGRNEDDALGIGKIRTVTIRLVSS